jgi:hypothetical protein
VVPEQVEESATRAGGKRVGGVGQWSWPSGTDGGGRAVPEPVWSRAPEPVEEVGGWGGVR